PSPSMRRLVPPPSSKVPEYPVRSGLLMMAGALVAGRPATRAPNHHDDVRLLRGVDCADGLAPAHRGGQEVVISTVGGLVRESVRVQTEHARQPRRAWVPRAGGTAQGDGLGGSWGARAAAAVEELARDGTLSSGAA